MPAGLVLGNGSVEFLVHAWDFARATGQQLTVSDGLASRPGPGRPAHHARGPRGGSFADPVQAGPDTGLLDRLIAFTGRPRFSSVH